LLERETNWDFPKVQKGKHPSMDMRHHGHMTLEVLWRNCRCPTSLSYQYSKHIEMLQEKDQPMDNDEHGRMSMPDRSDHSRMRSVSPRTLQQCSHCGTHCRAPTIRWKWNPVHKCIVHSGSECKVCKVVLAHLTDGAMEDNGSYINACDRHFASFIPIAQWRQDTSDLRRLRDDLEDSRRHEHDLKMEVDNLHVEINSLEASLKASNTALSYAAAARTQRLPQMHTKRAPAITKLTFVLNVVDSPQTVGPPTASSAVAKGKATALPTMDYVAALLYNDNEYNMDYGPVKDEAAEAKAMDSTCARYSMGLCPLTLLVLQGATLLRGGCPSCIKCRIPARSTHAGTSPC